MKNSPRTEKTVSAEQIARMAAGGNDISRFFSNTGKMVRPIQRVVDFKSPDVVGAEQALVKKLKRD